MAVITRDQAASNTAPVAGDSAQNGPQGPVNPFTRASRQHVEPVLDTTFTPGAAAQDLGTFEIPPFGFLRYLDVLVEASGGTGVAAVNAADGPYSAIQSIVITDVNGTPLFGPLTGYNAFLVQKYGGYAFQSDPSEFSTYANPTNGNLKFFLRIPFEIVSRNALGALANANASSTYRVQITGAALGSIWTTDPTTVPSIRVRAWAEEWTIPDLADAMGVPNQQQPPNLGTTQFWTNQIWVVASGQNTPRLQRVGNYLRNVVLVARDSSGVRDDTVFPESFTLMLDGRILLAESATLLRQHNQEEYGYDAAQTDAGVYVIGYASDFDGHPGGEMTDLWLPTTQATRYELQGSFGAAGTLEFLVNDVAAYVGPLGG